VVHLPLTVTVYVECLNDLKSQNHGSRVAYETMRECAAPS
jgi:hypothetical protein